MTNSSTHDTPANGGQILTDERASYKAAESAWEAMGRSRGASDSFLCFLEGYRASLAAPAIPTVDRNAQEGWKLVPLEMTAPMLAAAMQWVANWKYMNTATKHVHMREAYTAAIEAAPVAQPAAQVAVSEAARDVLAERQRQMLIEGWTPEHDDTHSGGDMACAAAVYALVGSSDGRLRGDELTPSITQRLWPWAWPWFKPTGRRRNLVKAGALLLAEIERIDRATPATDKTAEGK